VRRLAAAAIVVAALLAGCGGHSGGRATLWVTRDEGRTVLVDEQVPAGETALQALDRAADIKTRYGGKFVQSVNGIEGSIAKRHDWFYFVNGIEAGRGAQEYRLHSGDVLWWDYRDWGRMGQDVSAVVGAFPEPFVHGYGGKVPSAYVRGTSDKRILSLLHAQHLDGAAPKDANVLVVAPGSANSFTARANGDHVRFVFTGDPKKLLDRSFYLRKYRVG
jgi:hypothetical protein